MHKVGIIGFGGMGAGWHTKQLPKTKRAEVIAAYDINPDKVKAAREAGLIGYDTLDELLANKDIDLVVVATPNNFHKELSIAALRAGKNVICEKPVMMNAKDLEDVIKVMNETGMKFTAHQNRRWDTDFLITKKVLEENIIGKPFYIESRVQGCRGIPGDWRCVKVAGGGMIFDWGVHLIDQLMWMIDSPVEHVYCQMLSVKFPEVDDNFKLHLKFANGVYALVQIDTYCFINLPLWHVEGEHGTLAINDWDCNGKIVKSKTLEMKWEPGVVWTNAGPTKTMAPRPVESLEEIKLPSPDWDKIVSFYDNFLDAIEGKAEQIVKPSESLRVMKVIDAAFKSAEEGIVVKGPF